MDYKGTRLKPFALKILSAYTVIAYHGIGHNNSLPRIRRVSKDFNISGHGSVKHYFAGSFFKIAPLRFLIYGTVFSIKYAFKQYTDLSNKCFYLIENFIIFRVLFQYKY